jgi:hypothetical protein
VFCPLLSNGAIEDTGPAEPVSMKAICDGFRPSILIWKWVSRQTPQLVAANSNVPLIFYIFPSFDAGPKW